MLEREKQRVLAMEASHTGCEFVGMGFDKDNVLIKNLIAGRPIPAQSGSRLKATEQPA